jgi:chromosomal replication initiation ATPase DnaA
MTRQLAFDLPVRPALGREDFYVSPANTTALKSIEGWASWPQRRLLLIGPDGAGKTHLTHVWAALADAQIVPVGDLSIGAVPGLAAKKAIAIEDADQGIGEPALFHLLNLLAAEGGTLLMTATQPPARWNLSLPDLQSRLQATATATLEAPDDALLQAVLVKQFADRQISVSPRLISYLVPRIERSFAAARQIVADLDAAALARGGRVNQSLAAAFLEGTGDNNS